MEEGETVTLKNGDDTDETAKITAEAFVCDEEVLQQALEALSRQHLEQVEYDSRHVRGELTLSEAGRVILSIPYEDGWNVRINGESAEPVLFGGTLMAFDLEPGKYTFEMSYTPEGAMAGILISIVSILIFAVLMYGGYRRKRVVCDYLHENPDMKEDLM